jgi:hypothetical protein
MSVTLTSTVAIKTAIASTRGSAGVTAGALLYGMTGGHLRFRPRKE